jgi:hypothetical protein
MRVALRSSFSKLKGNKMASSTQNDTPFNKFIDVQKALKGVTYPADKQTLLEAAKSNGADDEALKQLEGLADGEYGSPAEVSKGVGNE